MKHKFFLYLLITSLIIAGCNNENQLKQKQQNFKQLNLTILIDLSDRISVKKYPEQSSKDIQIITFVLNNFKDFLKSKGVVNTEDKIKVVFYPSLNYELYQNIADSLTIDFEKLEFHERRKTYNRMDDLFKEKLNKLYETAAKAKTFHGSDLFNYFKHRVYDDCIIEDPNYINLLVILTDGYIFDVNAQYKIKNRYSYLVPKASHVSMFRKMKNWEEYFDNKDFGLINTQNDLSKLNVLVAELNPVKQYPQDFDIMKKYWEKWLMEQNVKKSNFKVLKTDYPSINKNIIEKFFNNLVSREQ